MIQSTQQNNTKLNSTQSIQEATLLSRFNQLSVNEVKDGIIEDQSSKTSINGALGLDIGQNTPINEYKVCEVDSEQQQATIEAKQSPETRQKRSEYIFKLKKPQSYSNFKTPTGLDYYMEKMDVFIKNKFTNKETVTKSVFDDALCEGDSQYLSNLNNPLAEFLFNKKHTFNDRLILLMNRYTTSNSSLIKYSNKPR